MATLDITFHSDVLARTVPLKAFIPLEGPTGHPAPLPAFYLLHGLYGSQGDWLQYTRVALWAREQGIALFCPAGENSFYVNQASNDMDYMRFIGEELVDFTRQMFPISTHRSDTFIGGLSMGGYGALNAGYSYPKTFGKVVALSAALEPWQRMDKADAASPVERPSYAKALFGENMEPWDTLALARRCGMAAPAIYMACGTEDPLLPLNLTFANALREEGLPLQHFSTSPGGHNWNFWDQEIKQAMQWLGKGEI